jgi:hypothetical protein
MPGETRFSIVRKAAKRDEFHCQPHSASDGDHMRLYLAVDWT